MSEQSAPPQPPPQARLAQMATGFILSRLVYTAASLGIADHLASSSQVRRRTGHSHGVRCRFARPVHADAHELRHPGTR